MGAELYLDCEFNGHGGQLLSLALANPTRTGANFYMRLPDPPKWNPWVLEHVVPFFGIEPVDKIYFRKCLQIYLQARDPVTIYADWPADFYHLTDMMCGAAFEDSWSFKCNMVLVPGSDPKPAIPHNAMSDALALMDWHQKRLSQGGYETAVCSW